MTRLWQTTCDLPEHAFADCAEAFNSVSDFTNIRRNSMTTAFHDATCKSPQSEVKCMLWDYGRVIRPFDHLRACRKLARLSGGKFTAEEIYELVFGKGLHADFDRGEIEPYDFVERLRTLLSIPKEVSYFQIWFAWCDIFDEPDNLVCHILSRIPGHIRCVLASNTDAAHYAFFRVRTPALNYLDGEVLSWRVNHSKPSAAYFRAAVIAAGCLPEEILLVDDKPENLAGAAELGMQTLHYLRGEVDLEAALRARGIQLQAVHRFEGKPLRASLSLEHSPIILGIDASTGSVKIVAFDFAGRTIAAQSESITLDRHQTPLGRTSEMPLAELHRALHGAVRALTQQLAAAGRARDVVGVGISATHHSAAIVSQDGELVVRPLTMWNDQTLTHWHNEAESRLSPAEALALLGVPVAERYTRNQLVRDEHQLTTKQWQQAKYLLPHGSLVAGLLTGSWNNCSVSSGVSTGLMDARTGAWEPQALRVVKDAALAARISRMLPTVLPWNREVGRLQIVPLEVPVFPAADDQAAGLVGVNCLKDNEVCVVFGTSTVVNASLRSESPPASSRLDVMRLSSGPWLLMKCFGNGSDTLRLILAENLPVDPESWRQLENVAAGLSIADAPLLLGLLQPEPCLGIRTSCLEWPDGEPFDPPTRYLSVLKFLAFLARLGLEEHLEDGRRFSLVRVTGGIARSLLLLEILSAAVDLPCCRVATEEGPALGAAVMALAALESQVSERPGDEWVADVAARMVHVDTRVNPNVTIRDVLEVQFKRFRALLSDHARNSAQ